MNYDDIINLEHPTSKVHPRMPLENRCAQFAPFSALSGYKESIYEAGRIVNKKIELTDLEKEEINQKLLFLSDHLNDKIEVNITSFRKDLKKDGGVYLTDTSSIKKIDLYKREILLENNLKILIENILSIEFIDSKYFDI